MTAARKQPLGPQRRAGTTVGAVATTLALLGLPGDALAAINQPPQAPHSITVFPQRDMVSAEGYAATNRPTVEVLRNGLLLARASEIVPLDDPGTPAFDGIVEINHPGAACWGDGAGSPFVTPDILPGDVVRITTAPDTGDQITTANVVAEAVIDRGNGTVQVHGTARDAAGNPLPIEQVEQRIVAPGASFARNGRRTLRADSSGGSDGTLAYDAPGSTAWTATYSGLSAGDIALAVSNQSRGMWLGTNPAAEAELTIYEEDEVGGPAAPCTAPAATNAISTSSPNLVNAGFLTSGADLVLTGIAQGNVTRVDVSLDDEDALTPPVTAFVTLPGAGSGQTFTARIPAFSVASLADGSLTAAARYGVGAATIDGTPMTIVKDTVAPATPGASPVAGAFNADQFVTLSAESGSSIAYTTEGQDVTPTSPSYAGPITVNTSKTIKALAVDAAGNPSLPGSLAYTIDKQAPSTTEKVPAGFQAADVEVTLLTGDGTGVGVAETWFTIDGSDPSVTSNPERKLYDPAAKPMLADGERIRYFSIDAVGNAESVKSSVAVKVDTSAPASSDDVPVGVQAADVTVSLTADDGTGSGVAATWFTTDGSDPSDAANPARKAYGAASKPVLADGERVRYHSIDKVGNAEAVKQSAAAKVDQSRPSTSDDVPAGFSAGDVTVTLTATDGTGAGVKETWYTTDGSDPSLAINPARQRYSADAKPVLTDGQRIRYYSADQAGNAEAVKASPAAQVDKAAPTTTDDVPSTFTGTSIKVTLASSDGTGAGVKETWYTTDGSDPSLPANPARTLYDPIARATLATGEKIRYHSIDNVGNIEAVKVSAPANVDVKAPVTLDNVPADLQPTDITVTLSASDGAGSGIKETWFTTDGSDPALASNPSRRLYDQATKPVLGNGERIAYYSVDNAGNAETVKFSSVAKVGTAPAPQPPTPQPPANGGQGGSVSVNVNVSPTVSQTANPTVTQSPTISATVKLSLPLGATRVPEALTESAVKADGLPVETNVPTGVGVVSYEIAEQGAAASMAKVGGKRIAKVFGFPKKPGIFRKSLKSTAVRRSLKRGSYRLVVRMGRTKSELGRAKTIRFRVGR
jgi:hypothetical protein